ncbi:MAG: uroporphyrinogen decarboxylase family protein [Saccharofermentanales bacterium]
MKSRERVFNAYYRKGYDRIPVKHEGTPEINHMLMNHFGLKNHEQLLRVLGDDFRYAEAAYTGPELKRFPDGSFEGYWGERYKYMQFATGKYMESVYQPFAGIDTKEKLDRSHFPSPDWFDYSTIKEQCKKISGEFAVCFGGPGDMDFINSISRARGMEEVLMDMADDNEVFIEILEHRFNFYYEMHRKALEAADGLIDFTHIGEDLGNQIGPMISMELFERHFTPKFRKYFDMAHSHGAKVMMHMCGNVYMFLPRLIELGLDIQDVVQPTGPEMDIANLKERFGARLVFQGSMDVQKEIAFGTPDDIRREVRKRLDLFKEGGLFLGPSHAIQAGSPLENILAMYDEAGSLIENIDDEILSVAGDKDEDAVNMAKLF